MSCNCQPRQVSAFFTLRNAINFLKPKKAKFVWGSLHNHIT